MKLIYFASLLIASLIMTLVSCTKHKDDYEENIPVGTINFQSPINSSIYPAGDSILIKATAISTASIHGYDIIIRKTNDTAKIFFQHVHDHNDTLYINKKWKSTVLAPADMEAQVILYLDHDGNTLSKKAMFRIQ